MGYDSTYYFVEKSSIGPDTHQGHTKSMTYSVLIASVRVGKHYKLYNAFPETKANLYFFTEDGNNPITSDAYNKPLTQASIKEFDKILANISSENIKPTTLYILKHIVIALLDNPNIYVLHFGS